MPKFIRAFFTAALAMALAAFMAGTVLAQSKGTQQDHLLEGQVG